MDWGQLPQQLVNGVQLGAVYALIALGYTMVYGVLKLINFAHGDIYMVGAYLAYYTAMVWVDRQAPHPIIELLLLVIMLVLGCLLVFLILRRLLSLLLRRWRAVPTIAAVAFGGLGLLVGGYFSFRYAFGEASSRPINPFMLLGFMLLISMTGCATLGVIIERLAYRPIRSAPRISALITAVGVSLFLEYSGRLVFQTSPQPSIVEEVNVLAKPLQFLGITIQQSQLAVLIVTVFLMLLLWQFVTRTAMGRAMRAASHDFSTAALMGVDVNRVVVVTFIIGSSLAGAGGMMNATAFGTPLQTFIGLLPGVKAFVAAVLGGIGNIPGAVVGGLIMGVAEVLVVWAGYAGYRDAVAFVILIVILLFRPGGLFGSTADKV